MDYILNEYHRNISNQELLNDIKSTAEKLNKKVLTQDEYSRYGKYSPTTVRRRFGGWNKALQLCGMCPNAYQLGAAKSKPLYQHISDEDLLSDVSAVAQRLHKDTVSCAEYARNGKFSRDTCFKRFGNWENVLLKAGLAPQEQKSGKRVLDELLMEEIERVWIQLGRQPTATDIKNGVSKYSLNTYTRHFRGWRGALNAFIKWVDSDKIEIDDASITKAQTRRSLEVVPVYSAKVLHTTTRDINLRLRFKVLLRDNFKCCLCGASPAKDPSVELHIDHIIPWSKGGETVIDNLQTLCSKCNLGKSDSSV